jgi:DNA-directed RNA polymerase specialized sigma24 family protein
MNTKEYNTSVENHAEAIYRFVLKHLRNEISSQDVVQETFMKVWSKHEEISAEKSKS